MVNLDQFFMREYDTQKYNCAHFVSEVWKHLTGCDIQEVMHGFLLPPKKRFVRSSLRRKFEKLEKATHGCIVLLNRVKGPAHVGLFLDGKVLHIQKTGVVFQPLDVVRLGFKTCRFYNVKNCCSS